MKANFTMIPNVIIRNPKITPYAKAIYIALKSFSPSFPSYKKIMEVTGINSKTTISNCLKILVTFGVLKISQRATHKSNLYEFPADLNSPIDGLEFVHEVDTNKTNLKIPNNKASEPSTDPPVEDSKRKKLFAEAQSSLGTGAGLGYIPKERPTFIIEASKKDV